MNIPLMVAFLVLCFSCQKKDTQYAESIIAGLDLNASKEDVISKFQKNFSSCSDSNEETNCFWKEGSPIMMVAFRNGKIMSVAFDGGEMSFADVVTHLRSDQSNVTIKPMPMGTPVDESLLEIIRQGGMNVMDGSVGVKIGDTLNLGCSAEVPFHKGKIRYLGSQRDSAIKNCTDEVFAKLTSKGFLYHDNDIKD